MNSLKFLGEFMANTKSAKKSIRVNRRNEAVNKVYKTRIKTTRKKILEQLQLTNDQSLTAAQKLLNLYYKRIDLAVKKNIIHKNTAARRKSQMARKLSQLKN